MTDIVLEARGVTRTFRQGPAELQVLRGVELDIEAGARLAIIGSSGSGKTTLLQVLGGLDAPQGGSVRVEGQDIHKLAERARCELRNRTLGFVYQFHHLLAEFSALENVAMPLLVRRMAPARGARARGRAAHARGSGRASDASSARALRWRAPACGRGARAGRGAASGARGRADRQSRRSECRAGVRADAGAEPRTAHQPRHRDARSQARAARWIAC